MNSCHLSFSFVSGFRPGDRKAVFSDGGDRRTCKC